MDEGYFWEDLEGQALEDEGRDIPEVPQGEWEGYLPAFPPLFFGEEKELEGDQIILSPACLEEFTERGLEFPLFFTITNIALDRTLSCRAYEFNGPPDVAILSPWLFEQLFLEYGDTTQIQYCQMPKAKSIKLKPESGEYLQWSNQKAVLEASIKAYATVTVNSVLELEFGGKVFRFTVEELEPGPHASLIDTDVVVDMVEEVRVPASLDFTMGGESQQEQVKNEPAEQEDDSLTIPTGAAPKRTRRRRRGEEAPEETKSEKEAPATFQGRGYSLTPSGASPPAQSLGPGRSLRQAAPIPIESKAEVETNTPAPFSGHGQSVQASTPTASAPEPEEQPEGTTRCANCKKFIPEHTFRMHSAYCERNNYCCETCGQVVPKAKKDEHLETHKPIPCPDCGKEMEEPLLAAHLENECPKRLVRCEYCELKFPDDEFVAHEQFCGSRTEKCDTCGKYIMLRDLTVHPTVCGQEEEAPPVAQYEGYAAIPQDNDMDLSFCPYCLDPFATQQDMLSHITSQFEVLMGQVVTQDYNDLESVLVHVGSITDPDELELLISALLESESVEGLRKLLAQGTIKPDICPVLKNRTLPLVHHAVEHNNAAAVKVLSEFQANIDALDDKGKTALHRAVQAANINCVRALLVAGARTDFAGTNQKLPLLCALDHADRSSEAKKIPRVLISAGATLQGIRLKGSHWKTVRNAGAGMLLELYSDQAEEPRTLSKTLARFFSADNGCHLDTASKIQKCFLQKIHHQSDFLSARCNDGEFRCRIHEGRISMHLLNDGTIPLSYQFFLPLDDVKTRLQQDRRTLKPNEETTCTIHLDEPSSDTLERLEGKCVTVQLLSQDPRSGLDGQVALFLQITRDEA